MGVGALCRKWSTVGMAECLGTATVPSQGVMAVSVGGGADLPLLAPPDAGLDESVDVAVEDRRRVADLVLGPEVLDHLVRVQHVGPHLITPGTGHVTLQGV